MTLSPINHFAMPFKDLGFSMPRDMGSGSAGPGDVLLSQAGMLEGEYLVSKLKQPLSQPTLFLTDISGNYDALVEALLKRNFINVTESGDISVSDIGKQSQLVLGGDLNDRGCQFPEIVKLISYLRDSGMRVRTLLGNHELFMISALFMDFPEPDHIDIPGAVGLWLNSNGGDALIESLAREYLNLYPETESLTPNVEEQKFLHALSIYGNLEKYSSELLMSRRMIRTEPYVSFIAELLPTYSDGPLLFAHSMLPEIGIEFPTIENFKQMKREGQLDKSELLKGFASIEDLNMWVNHARTSSFKTWSLGFGMSTSPSKQDPTKTVNSTLNPSDEHLEGTYELFWKRASYFNCTRATFSPRNLPFSQTTADYLKSQGIECLVRGHDPVHLIFSEKNHFLVDNFGVQVINADVQVGPKRDRQSGKVRQSNAYLYFSVQGDVFGFNQEF